MRIYSSFLIRCWRIQDPSQGERSVFDVEHIQTGNRQRVASLNEATEWMLAVGLTARPATEAWELENDNE